MPQAKFKQPSLPLSQTKKTECGKNILKTHLEVSNILKAEAKKFKPGADKQGLKPKKLFNNTKQEKIKCQHTPSKKK